MCAKRKYKSVVYMSAYHTAIHFPNTKPLSAHTMATTHEKRAVLLLSLVVMLGAVAAQSSGGGGGGGGRAGGGGTTYRSSGSGGDGGGGGGSCDSECARTWYIILGVVGGFGFFGVLVCCCGSSIDAWFKARTKVQYDKIAHQQVLDRASWNAVRGWKGFYEGTSYRNRGQHEQTLGSVQFAAATWSGGVWSATIVGNDNVGAFDMLGMVNPHNGKLFVVKEYRHVINKPVEYDGAWNVETQKFMGRWQFNDRSESGNFEFGPATAPPHRLDFGARPLAHAAAAQAAAVEIVIDPKVPVAESPMVAESGLSEVPLFHVPRCPPPSPVCAQVA